MPLYAPSTATLPDGWISPKDTSYGCVGDGVTDDTVGFHKALDDATSNGLTLYVPIGNYAVRYLNVTQKNGWRITSPSPNLQFQSGKSRLYITGKGDITCTFQGTLANTNVSQMTINTSGLTPTTASATAGVVTTYQGGGASVNEQQAITLNAISGTYTLTFGGNTTTALNWNDSPATVQSALEALPSIGSGNISCAYSGGSGLHIKGCAGFIIENLGIDYLDPLFAGSAINLDGTGADIDVWTLRNVGTKTRAGVNSALAGLRLHKAIIGSVEHGHFCGGQQGILVGDQSYSNGVQIEKSTFNGNTLAHVMIGGDDVEQTTIRDCVFEAGINTTGIAGTLHNQCYELVIENNWFGDASTNTTWIDGLYSIRGPVVIRGNYFADVHTGGHIIKFGRTDGSNTGGSFLFYGNAGEIGPAAYVFGHYGASNLKVKSWGNDGLTGVVNVWDTTSLAVPSNYSTIETVDDVNNFTKPLSPGGNADVAIGGGETAGQFVIANGGGTTGVFATLPSGRNGIYVNTVSGGGRRIVVQAMPTTGSGVALGGGLVTGPMVETVDNKVGLYGVTPVVMPASTGTSTGFTAGAGTAVNDQSTFTGNVGMSAPGGFTATAVASGGTFAAGTYFWQITALNAAGETVGSTEKSATIVLNGSCNLAWNRVPGATSYKIYRATSSGAENVSPALVTTIASNTTTTYTDTGTATSAGAVPGSSTATMAYRISDIVKALKQIGALTP